MVRAPRLLLEHSLIVRGRDTSNLKHGTGRNADIVLVPQPSDSPRDPLNWPTWKKDLALLIISVDTAVVGAWYATPWFVMMFTNTTRGDL